MRLETRELGFGYPGKPIGRGVTLAVEPGQVLCLLGPNGCGKTTLFKTMLGLLPAQGGAVTIGGESIAGWPRARLGLFATPAPTDREAAEAALDALRILHLKGQVYTRISGGQRQLVLIARALAQDAGTIVMDEPTASLDFGNQILVLAQIKTLARRGIGIVLSTHDPDQAFACADRVAMLHEGRLFRLGPPQDVITAADLREIYGVEVEIVCLPDSGRHVCVPALGGRAPSGRGPISPA